MEGAPGAWCLDARDAAMQGLTAPDWSHWVKVGGIFPPSRHL